MKCNRRRTLVCAGHARAPGKIKVKGYDGSPHPSHFSIDRSPLEISAVVPLRRRKALGKDASLATKFIGHRTRCCAEANHCRLQPVFFAEIESRPYTPYQISKKSVIDDHSQIRKDLDPVSLGQIPLADDRDIAEG